MTDLTQVELVVVTTALVARASGLSQLPGYEWSRLTPLPDAASWALLGLYCAGVLFGQLLMAAGYTTTRASIAAFLALSEVAFAYVLGAVALAEPTNALAGLGTALTLGGSVLLVAASQRGTTRRDGSDPHTRGDGACRSATLAGADAQRINIGDEDSFDMASCVEIDRTADASGAASLRSCATMG